MRQLGKLVLAGSALAAIGGGAVNYGQANAQSVSEYPSQTEYPNEDREAVSRHLARARAIAGDDLWAEFRWRCLISPLDTPRVRGVQHDGLLPATQVFDEVYSVGQNAVSAYAINTSDGIILIDALNNPEEAEQIIVPNLKAVGLDPANLRYVIVSHGHGDHYGGAKYLHDTYGARVVASAADWDLMANARNGSGAFSQLVPPEKDIVIDDGGEITLGDTTVKFYVTPGHTPGTLSMVFPVHDNGERHMAGFMGGTGGGRAADAARAQIASLERWQDITAQAGVDVLLTNHPAHNDANEKQVLLRYDATGGHNPFVYGETRYQRFMQIMSECARTRLARYGEPSD